MNREGQTEIVRQTGSQQVRGQRSEKSLFMCIYVKEECGLAPLPSGLLSLIERVTKYTLSQYGLGQ